MNRRELISLRDDALSVIIELYRMPPADRMASADRQFTLQRAIAMHNAAVKQLEQWDVVHRDALRMEAANEEHERLKRIENCAIAVAQAWRAGEPLNKCSNYVLFTAVEFLAMEIPAEGGA